MKHPESTGAPAHYLRNRYVMRVVNTTGIARAEELLRWSDTLEAQLHQTGILGAHLLASTLHHLLAA